MLEYIAGFFDADGCVTLTKDHKSKHRSPQVSFVNNERAILETIREYFGYGTICKKPARKENHNSSYDLQYTHRRAMQVLEAIYPFMLHSRKRHRTKLILEEYLSVTDRQGNYTGKMLIAKRDFEERFFNDSQ